MSDPAQADVAGNLPATMTTFVGRGPDLDALPDLLRGARLITLAGGGGHGKTRLALEVAARCASEFGGGTWLVELASVSDGALVPVAIAAVLEVPEEPGQPLLATLASHIGHADVLLVLDNCEQVVEACALLADRLLRGCPELHIIATSREPLGISGEAVWPVGPFPAVDPTTTAEVLSASDAVRLFVDRATLARPDFALSGENLAGVVGICNRLDGIPLAIELAAARVRSMTLAEISERLDDRFALLTGGSRAADARHQTLRAALDWSHDLPHRRGKHVVPTAGGVRRWMHARYCNRGVRRPRGRRCRNARPHHQAGRPVARGRRGRWRRHAVRTARNPS